MFSAIDTHDFETKVNQAKKFLQGGDKLKVSVRFRKRAIAHPQIGENQFGGESVTYTGVGSAKKWERLESYGPKFVENIVQAVARDLLMYSMQTLSHCFIVATVHDEMIIECSMGVSLEVICEQMARTPAWAEGLLLRADGYECEFYKKD